MYCYLQPFRSWLSPGALGSSPESIEDMISLRSPCDSFFSRCHGIIPDKGNLRKSGLWLSVSETQSGMVAEEQGCWSHGMRSQEAGTDAGALLTVLRSRTMCGMLQPTSRVGL